MVRHTFHSPWGIYAAIVQGIGGFLFGTIPFAPDASRGEALTFGFLGVALVAGAVRACFMRVVLEGRHLSVHGFLTTREMFIQSVEPEITDDKLIAAVWAPVVTTTNGVRESLAVLSGYASTRRPNRRVARVCNRIMDALDAA